MTKTRIETVWIRGHELQLGDTIKVARRWRSVTFLKWRKGKWFRGPGDIVETDQLYIETDANFAMSAFASSHFERQVKVNEQVRLAL